MGLEYPLLTIIVSIAFIIIVLSSLFLYLHIVEYSDRSPILDSSATFKEEGDAVRILIIIKHMRGEPVELKFIDIVTDVGTLRIYFPWLDKNYSTDLITVEAIGFMDNYSILPGSTSRLVISLPKKYFEGRKECGIVIVFDKSIITLVIDINSVK
ncbi:MAG: hypothetical protein QXT75_04590 [Desulfurococcaceae archaeon]